MSEATASDKPPEISAFAGLDTAANRLHLVCTRWPASTPFSASLIIPDRPKLSADECRHRLFLFARAVFGLLPAKTVIVAEEPLALRNGKTTRLLALAAGAIWTAHLQYDVYWFWADVAAWKKAVIGNGNADKGRVEQWVREQMGLEFPESDFYDAAALCRYGEQMFGALDSDDSGRT